MKIEKIHLDDIYRCYSASSVVVDGVCNILLASEEKGGVGYAYHGEQFEGKELLWEGVGGVMSMIAIPNKSNEFIAIQEFYLKESNSQSKLVWAKHTKHGWETKDILVLPYLHRFDLYEVGDVIYVICATIAEQKQDKEDWSTPGSIYVGELSQDWNQPLNVSRIKTGLYRNHGYCRDEEAGHVVGYFGSDQGILKVSPPARKGEPWKSTFILENTPISEIALIDINGDGEKEIMTIEPFHGNQIHIYQKQNEAYQKVYTYPNEIEFAHSLVADTIQNRPMFLIGIRRKQAELAYVVYENGNYQHHIIEEGCGPANLAVVHESKRDIIVAANHTKNEAAAYIIRKEE